MVANINTPPPEAHQDPPPDRDATSMPDNIAVVLHLVGVLLSYGRHLLDTLHQRAAAPDFNAIAACFGSAKLVTILAHLQRGLLRAEALKRVLLARAATGKDAPFVPRRTREPKPAPVAIEPGQQAAEAEPPKPRRPRRPAGWDDPELYMPTLEELIHEVRRRPLGRTLAAISSDLGVIPEFCLPPIWNALFEVIHHFGGSVVAVMRKKYRRYKALIEEQDHIRGSDWDWMRLHRDGFRELLGFFIGEPPVNPLDPVPP